MNRYGRQSPPPSSAWPPPPRRASTALDLGNEATDMSYGARYSSQAGQHLYSGAAAAGGGDGGGNTGGGYGGSHGFSSRPSSRPVSTYGPYAGLSGYGGSNNLGQDGIGSGGGGGGGGGGGEGTGGAGADDVSSRERVNQVIQNFYLKAAMTIIQQRVPVAPLYASRTNSKRVNKWNAWADLQPQFNLDLDDTDAFREELSLWKSADIYRQHLPPLIVETYIDAKDLTANQTLVLLDEQGRRWNVDTEMSRIIDVPSGPRKAGRVNEIKPDVVLERWVVELRPRKDGIPPPELPVAYKHGVVLFRNLYTYAGLMPTQKLLRRLAKVKVHPNALKICCRIIPGDTPSPRWDGLELQLIEGGGPVTESYSFGSVDTPAGQMHINVTYRKECDFRVDDSEALLSSHFINLDEHYFQPSLKAHQRTASQPQFTQRDVGSLPSGIANNTARPDLHTYGSSVTPYPQGSLRGQNPTAGASLSSSPADPPYMNLRSLQGSKSSLRSVDNAGVQRRPSVSFMQPFKSPSLSNSPSSDAIPSSPRTSVTRISSTTTAPIQARARTTISPIVQRNSFTPDSQGPLGTSASPKPQSIGRYSSSFGLRKPRPSTGTSRMDDDNSSGKGSYSSSIAAPSSSILNEQPGPVYSFPNDDQKVVDFLSLLDKQPMKMFDQRDSCQKTNTALSKFQKMRESHNALSDTMSASLLLGRPNSSPSSSSRQLPAITPSTLPVASFSPSSSPGKPQSPYTPHTPAVPSRLSAGHTAHQDESQAQQKTGGRKEDQKTTTTTTTATTTSPLDIPSSPRAYPNSHGRPSSFSLQQRQLRYENDSAEFDSPSVPGDGPVYGPQSASLGSVENMMPLSLSKLAELKLASEEDLPGREAIRDQHHHQHQHHRTQSADQRNVVRGGFSGGLSGSSSSSIRGRVYSQRGTIGRGMQPDGVATAAPNERPSLVGRRTPSYPRGGFDEGEDLLFAMSDMSGRRSMDQDRGLAGVEVGEMNMGSAAITTGPSARFGRKGEMGSGGASGSGNGSGVSSSAGTGNGGNGNNSGVSGSSNNSSSSAAGGGGTGGRLW